LIALPALSRVVEADHRYKATFFLVLKYWLTTTADRIKSTDITSPAFLNGNAVNGLLDAARTRAETDQEIIALDFIRKNPHFSPAEFLCGAL
jgi:hypothetical protein